MKAHALTFLSGAAERMPAPSSTRPSLLARLATWHRVARERRRLLDVDPRLLADMGLSPEQAAYEASRPFWDVNARR